MNWMFKSWIVCHMKEKLNLKSERVACQTPIKLSNQLCVDSIRKLFWRFFLQRIAFLGRRQICLKKQKFPDQMIFPQAPILFKIFFIVNCKVEGGLDFIALFWSELSNFGGANMQYRGKNQMSPDLFSLPDSLTQKTQEWFLNFFISIQEII